MNVKRSRGDRVPVPAQFLLGKTICDSLLCNGESRVIGEENVLLGIVAIVSVLAAILLPIFQVAPLEGSSTLDPSVFDQSTSGSLPNGLFHCGLVLNAGTMAFLPDGEYPGSNRIPVDNYQWIRNG